MPRNIVVCCDGTSNEFAGTDRTNVAKLCLRPGQGPGPAAGATIIPVVGTMAAARLRDWTGRRSLGTRRRGLAFGYGVRRATSATRTCGSWINWRARRPPATCSASAAAPIRHACVAALLRHVRPGDRRADSRRSSRTPSGCCGLAARDRTTRETSRSVSFELARSSSRRALWRSRAGPHFVGVWDTVSSVGWMGSPVGAPFHAARRSRYSGMRGTRWRSTSGAPSSAPTCWSRVRRAEDAVQVWFPGVHCDVGGGYAEG